MEPAVLPDPISARARIPEYWIINVRKRSVEVLRNPVPRSGRYRTRITLQGPDMLKPMALPGPSLVVEWLFQ